MAWRRWKGLPENASRSGLGALQRQKQDRERSLDTKKAQLADLLVQQISFRNLARRNRFNASARAAASAAAAENGVECAGDQDAEELAASKVRVMVVARARVVLYILSISGILSVFDAKPDLFHAGGLGLGLGRFNFSTPALCR